MKLSLTNNFAQDLIILLAISLGIFVIFLGIYYLYKSNLITNWLEKNSKYIFWKKILSQAVIGIAIGLLCFILVKIQFVLNFEGIIIFFIPIFLTIGLLFSLTTMAIGVLTMLCYLIPMQTNCLINNSLELTNLAILYPFIILIIGIIWIAIIRILKLQSKIYINFISIILYYGISLLIAYLMLHKEAIAVLAIELCVNAIMLLIFYIVMITVINFVQKIKSLSKAVLYEKDYFINPIRAEQIIKEKLVKDEVNLGLMVIFGFTNIDKLPIQLGNYTSNFIQKQILEKLVKNFKDTDVLFYLTKNNEYACFFFLRDFNLNNLNLIYDGNALNKRNARDPFYDVYKKLYDIPNEIIYDKMHEQININASGAIYGVHSCEFNDLENLCRATKQSVMYTSKKNILQIYNPNTIINVSTSYNDIKDLNKYFDQKDFEVKLKKSNSFVNSHKKIFRPLCSSVNHLLFDLDSIKTYAKENNIYEITIRFLAMQCLQEFSRYKYNRRSKIVIPYCFKTIIDPNFNVGLFIKKVNTLNLNPSTIILGIDLDDEDTSSIHGVYDKIKELQGYNVSLYLKNFSDKNMGILKFIQPNYVSLKPLNQINKNTDSTLVDEYYTSLISIMKEKNIKLIADND